MSHFVRREQRDACAIIAFVDKRGKSTHANIVSTIDALRKMGHRSGDINGEGDGCGIQTDIPRDVWGRRLEEYGISRHLAESRNFFVGHFLVPHALRSRADEVIERINAELRAEGADLLMEVRGATRDGELGARACAEAPLFWQVAGLIADDSRQAARRRLFHLQMKIERNLPDVHISSLSLDSVVYKLRGVPDLLPKVYPELQDEDTRSVITLGHSRYSTNTLPTVERAQPFSILGHNGEINTIERLRSTGKVLGIEPVPGGSDSQDLNRILEGLIDLYGFDPLEALEMIFPAIHSEVERYPEELQNLYAFYRWFFPSSAQGPAAVVARYGEVCMGSVDALGLRPLWFGESDYDFYLSSERGVVDLEHTMRDAKPLAPGEKIAILSGRGRHAEVLDYGSFQKRLLSLMAGRKKPLRRIRSFFREIPGQFRKDREGRVEGIVFSDFAGWSADDLSEEQRNSEAYLSAFGWRQYDFTMRRKVAVNGRELIGSMGYQGPLACLVPETFPNISEYFKENVAVVTNPAIDREREAEHFTTRVILGDRPDAFGEKPSSVGLELKTPLLLCSECVSGLISREDLEDLAAEFGSARLEEVLDFFTAGRRDPGRVLLLDATFDPEKGLRKRLDHLCGEARDAIGKGAIILVLDDSRSFSDGRVFIDPGLAVAYLVRFLEQEGLRRECSLIVRSAAIRNLHDIMFLIGLGADALVPAQLWRMNCILADDAHSPFRLMKNTMEVLQKGIEKVMSTMGIHELCGYGRIFSSIGLSRELEEVFQVPNFCASETAGLSFGSLEKMARERYEAAHAGKDHKPYKVPARNPRVGRLIRKVAVGKAGFAEMTEGFERIDAENPVALRHVLGRRKRPGAGRLSMDEVDISIGRHSMPIVIAAMSFGSQGENSFRTYAEAAKRVNIICMNGEGGEIPDMLGKYRNNRGQQIASGRFGVFMGLLNSADYLEIKIGQGAKPGEGGHLPGTKVTEMVASARHCKPGITLISPSNQHDIYSIEDLAQIITELKTANPFAKVSVKIPITSGVGTIAVGVAKAGADIVNLSGFEGGTGAAREHAKKYVGLPAEIGVSEAHRALVECGLRDQVEIWCDGGMRSGLDVLKMIFLGANRVGFGTVALMGVGCISCQRCHLGSCPRGISTQIMTKKDAAELGVKGFAPRVIEDEVENLSRVLRAIGDELRSHLAALGEPCLCDLVGRTEMLVQERFHDRIDVSEILRKPQSAGVFEDNSMPNITRRPLNYLTKLISDIAMEKFRQGHHTVFYHDQGVVSSDRAVGTYLAGAMVREFGNESDRKAYLRLAESAPGNGLCAFTIPNIDTQVEGNSQDGAAKGSFGGGLKVLKGLNVLGARVGGSTGKSFAYGAIGGTLMVQNIADSRACVRMSGADVVFGGRITAPVRDEEGNIACRAHLKGFAFEYMTGGRAVVLGDPGPWICAGMTGGVIYQCLYPEYGFDRDAVKRRLAKGSNVSLKPVDEKGLSDVGELLGQYVDELRNNFQEREAAAVAKILSDAGQRFLMIVPRPMRPPSAE